MEWIALTEEIPLNLAEWGERIHVHSRIELGL